MSPKMPKMPHWPKPVGLLQNETSLHRMQEILARLGNPHLKLPRTIHAAGTNGKGSTLAFLQAMLEAAGHKVHKYISPHLIDFNERITLAGAHISDDFLFEIMEEVRINSDDLPLGFYEATTAGALLAFSRIPADFLLLETGLGGRLDATNIIPAPEIALMTTVDVDHTNFLGTDIRGIAIEKLHIVKKGSKCISSLQQDIIYQIIEGWCFRAEVPYTAFGYDFVVEIGEPARFVSEKHNFEIPTPGLIGDHQYINAGTAIAAALELGIGEDAIKRGVAEVKWPSRMERLNKKLPDGFELWIDGAHNSAGAYVIANYIKENWADKPIYLIFGTTQGRDVKSFLKHFTNVAAEIALSKIAFEPASYEPQQMAAQLDASHAQFANLNDTIEYFCTKPPGRILCIGSLFMRGDIN